MPYRSLPLCEPLLDLRVFWWPTAGVPVRPAAFGPQVARGAPLWPVRRVEVGAGCADGRATDSRRGVAAGWGSCMAPGALPINPSPPTVCPPRATRPSAFAPNARRSGCERRLRDVLQLTTRVRMPCAIPAPGRPPTPQSSLWAARPDIRPPPSRPRCPAPGSWALGLCARRSTCSTTSTRMRLVCSSTSRGTRRGLRRTGRRHFRNCHAAVACGARAAAMTRVGRCPCQWLLRPRRVAPLATRAHHPAVGRGARTAGTPTAGRATTGPSQARRSRTRTA